MLDDIFDFFFSFEYGGAQGPIKNRAKVLEEVLPHFSTITKGTQKSLEYDMNGGCVQILSESSGILAGPHHLTSTPT